MHYNVNLKTAIFSTNDAKLVPDAGSCKDCPKRTDNDPDLADLDKNVCTDQKCFEQKTIAHHAQIVAKASKKGLPVYEGATAAKAISAAKNNSDIYVVTETLLRRFDNLKSQNDAHRSFASAVGTDKLPDYVAVAFDGLAAVKLYDASAAQALLVDLGFCSTEAEVETKKFVERVGSSAINTPQDESEESSDEGSTGEGAEDTGSTDDLDQAAANDQRKRDVENEEIKRMRIYRAIRDKGQLSIDAFREYMLEIEDDYELRIPPQFHEEFYGTSLTEREDRQRYIKTASIEALQRLLIDFTVAAAKGPKQPYLEINFLNRVDRQYSLMKRVAEAEGIDIAIVEQEQVSPVQAQATEPTEPAAPAPKKRGRKSNAEKAALAAHEAATKPAPTEKWPFPTPKKESAES
jgi:hypothetical protein